MASKPKSSLDWAFAFLIFFLNFFSRLPFCQKGLQWFDEATQARMAQLAVGESIGPIPPHAFPSFHLLYKFLFTFFPLSISTLRLEVLMVQSLGIAAFAMIGRMFFSRFEVFMLVMAYWPFQEAFGPFAYYSREANTAVLIGSLVFLRGNLSSKSVYTIVAAVVFAIATGFKFNVGLLGAAAVIVVLGYRSAWFGIVFLVTLFALNASQGTSIFSTAVSMPISYAKAAYVGMPLKMIFFFLLSPLCFFYVNRNNRFRNSELQKRQWHFVIFLSFFLLLQNFPRHWIAHLVWVPLPFWLLGWQVVSPQPRKVAAWVLLFLLMCSWAVAWREVKPFSRLLSMKERFSIEKKFEHPRLNIALTAGESAVLERMHEVIARECPNPHEPIFVFPAQPLIYFLFNRPNATAFDNFHGGYRWQEAAIQQLRENPPCLIFSIPHEGPWGLRGQVEAPALHRFIYGENRVIDRIYSSDAYLFDVLKPPSSAV